MKDAITRMMTQFERGKAVDLLAISHFDQDHVNGLHELAGELKSRGIEVRNVWLPMLAPLDALYLAREDSTEQYVQFVANPVGSLGPMFPDAEITAIPPSGEPIPPSSEATDDDDSNDESDHVVVSVTRSAADSPVARVTPSRRREVLWEVVPYVTRSTIAGAKTVASSFKSFIDKDVDELTADDVARLAGNREFLAEFHEAVAIAHKGTPRSERDSSARTGANLSTLCLYSGPASPYDWCRHRSGWTHENVGPRWAIPSAPSWLGTGDAGLRRQQDVDALQRVLTPARLDRVGVCSVPHHGSRHDSGAPLWTALANLRHATVEAEHGPGSAGNHHPHSSVLKELQSREIRTHIVAEGNDFHWHDKRIR